MQTSSLEFTTPDPFVPTPSHATDSCDPTQDLERPQNHASLSVERPWRQSTRCPLCKSALEYGEQEVQCTADACQQRFPITACGPVLVDESRSLFRIQDFVEGQAGVFNDDETWRGRLSQYLPYIDWNPVAAKNFQRFKAELLQRFGTVRILVIGGGILGAGMECLLDDPNIELVESDVMVSPRTRVVCDAHDLPFVDGSFHGVVVQAVLEHVLEPWQVVSEIHRVLVPDGIVYADTPFIAQVHCQAYDFHRFTRLGHRRLFRHFSEIDSGISGGPAVATAWTLKYFALSFFESKWPRAAVSALARCTLFPLKYLDRWLIHKRGGYDAAMAFYFMGTKADQPLPDRDLIDSYIGGF